MQRVLFFILPIVFFSCTQEEEVNQKPDADFTYVDKIDEFELTSTSNDPDGDSLTYQWVAHHSDIAFKRNGKKYTRFDIPYLENPPEVNIELVVSDGKDDAAVTKAIQLPLLTNIRKWGLGRKLEDEHSNNVDYEWYMDQKDTGPHSGVNCGPTVVTMAIKWYDQSFIKTPQDARQTYRSSGGWWYTDDIINYLNKYEVPNVTIDLDNVDRIDQEVLAGNIVILCLDMYYISMEKKNEWHVDKFYLANDEGWGHFILVKGYKVLDGNTLYEAYDSYCWGEKYASGFLKGKDRYYRCPEIDEATDIWWDHAIVVSREPFSSTKGLNMDEIEHKPGK